MTAPFRILALAALLLAVAVPAPVTSAPAATPAARIAELQRAGRVTEALALCRQENAAHPGDPVMLYNQACLENRTGDAVGALRSLRAALDAGFADFDFALADPDLQGAAAAGVRTAIAEHRRARGSLSAQRGARLALGRPAVLALESAPGAPAARLTVTWAAAGLDLQLAADDTGGRFLPLAGARPWAGEAGLVVALGDLAGGDTGETADCFVFAFGAEKGAVAGVIFVAETGRWQRVRELQPKFHGAGTPQFVLEVTIPWTAISPYHPLVDPALGLNAVLVDQSGAWAARLMPAEVRDRPASPRQPAARLDFDLATAAPGALCGRTPTTIVTSGALALNLVATSERAGEGALTIDFRDGQGQSLLADGPQTRPVTLTAGLNTINRAVDFGQVRGGPCRVSASLAMPSGTVAEWSQWLLNLAPGWEAGYRTAIAELPADEQATATHYLVTVADAVSRHRSRRDPGPLTTTLGDLNLMLARFKQSGSLVPSEGLTPFVYPGPGGADRLCHLVVPAGRPAGVPLLPVVIAGHTTDDAPRLAERVLRFLGESGGKAGAVASAKAWPVYVIAPGDGGTGGPGAAPAASPEAAAAELRTCLQWTRMRFASGRILLAVQRGAVAPALAVARESVWSLDQLLVFADGDLLPWPGATAAELDHRVGPPPAGLDVTWVDFSQETELRGQGRALRDALRRAGWNVADEIVRGGANYTQVADRTCRWQSRHDDGAAAGR